MSSYRFEIGTGGSYREYQRIHASLIEAEALPDAIAIAESAAPLPFSGQKITLALLFDEKGVLVWYKSLEAGTSRSSTP